MKIVYLLILSKVLTMKNILFANWLQEYKWINLK